MIFDVELPFLWVLTIIVAIMRKHEKWPEFEEEKKSPWFLKLEEFILVQTQKETQILWVEG